MKKSKLLLMLALVFSTIFALSATAFALSGDGSEERPFVITNEDELALLNDFPDCNFELGNDIELTKKWVPIVETFTGTFDGKGHNITNLSSMFASSNRGTIENINITASEEGISGSCIFVNENWGNIVNCTVCGNVSSSTSVGGIVGYNYDTGIINNCVFNGSVSGGYYAGGITSQNAGTIICCVCKGNISADCFYSYHEVCGGLSGDNLGSITDSYFYGSLSYEQGYRIDSRYRYAYIGGIAGENGSHLNGGNGKITNCFAVVINQMGSSDDYNKLSGVSTNLGTSKITNSVYDKNTCGISTTTTGTPKSTLAMKMKKTYTDLGWDFENVWGIDENYNDGYPYLLWEREGEEQETEPSEPTEPTEPSEEPEDTSLAIVDAKSTDSSIKFISHVILNEKDTPASFGTIFIPMWLFNSPDATVARVEYSASENPIASGNTFGATLSDIPDGYKDVYFVGKSYIKLADGTYIWSNAKRASILTSMLRSVEE